MTDCVGQGCSFGYHAGGWGKPPVDESGKPLYGDVFGPAVQESQVRHTCNEYCKHSGCVLEIFIKKKLRKLCSLF